MVDHETELNKLKGEVILEKVGMPTMKGVGSSMIDFGVGAGGGIVYALASSLLGSGLIGGLLGAALAGSVIKGERGTTIATILGFQAIIGGLTPTSAVASSDNEGVM